MFRNILFIMSLSGSVVMVFYILFYPLAKRYFPLIWRYRILKTAMFFYLIPVAECKYHMLKLLKALFPALWDKIFAMKPSSFNLTYGIYIENGFIQLSPNIYKMFLITLLCVIISGIIYAKFFVQNHKLKRLYIVGENKIENTGLQEIFLETKKELNIKKQIRFICSEYCQSPVTSGVVFPTIWFPAYYEKEIDKREFRYMVKHELLHIKRNDILIKYLGLLVVAIHWFNPFSYLLYHELSAIGEMYCDNGVLQGQGEAGRREYGELLIQTATRKKPNDTYSLFVGMADKGYQKTMKRRIMEMKNNRRHKMVFSIVAMIIICMAGALAAFAYEVPNIITGQMDHAFSFDDIIIIGDPVNEPIPYDQYFMDDTGTIYEIKELNSLENADCSHEYISGSYNSHKKNSNEECTITTYNAQFCTSCGLMEAGDKTDTIIYKKCPHELLAERIKQHE